MDNVDETEVAEQGVHRVHVYPQFRKGEDIDNIEMINSHDKNTDMEIKPEFCEVKCETFEDTGGTLKKREMIC